MNTGTAVTVTFSEPMDPATINGTTFELMNPSSQLVPAAVAYNGPTNTATLTPAAPLANSTTYTARVVGGAAGVTDVTGNPLATDYTWSFTTAAAGSSDSASLWDDTFIPTILSDSDTNAVELGVKFQSDVDGYITALRFYKSATNTGTHVGNLWTAGGTLLASVTFTNETASGWQEMALPTPVAITANTTYIASYHTNVGRYSADSAYFASAYDNPPLTGAGRRRERRQRRLPLRRGRRLSQPDLECHQLLGRCGVSGEYRTTRHHTADGDIGFSGGWGDRGQPDGRRQCRLQRGHGSGHDKREQLRAARRRQ